MFGKVEELAIVLVIVLVLFGGKKLPALSKGIGESVREIRRGFRGEESPSVTDSTVSKSHVEHQAEAHSTDGAA